MLHPFPPARWITGLALLASACSDGLHSMSQTIASPGAPMAGAAAGSPGVPTAPGAGAGGASGGGGGAGGMAGAPAIDAGVDAASPAAGGSGSAGPAADAATADASKPAGCDRACLIAVMQSFIDALIANDPSALKVAAGLKYTENGVISMLGETVWQTASMLVADTRLDFADPVEGQVASHFVFNESNSMPVIYQVRLKVVEHEITEIETMAVRRQGAANGFFNVMNMKPEPAFFAEVAPEDRMSRDELRAITELYLDYLEGSKRGNELPFDMGCKRYENGQVTASGLSSFNLQSWSFDVTRRILVIDEEAGITWGLFPFTQAERALVVGEAFKIVGGKIMMIQAVMANQPAKVWD
jgi:hypothetical protein